MTRARRTRSVRARPARGQRGRARGEAGFTLMEAVAALGVFAIAALSLMRLNTENVRALGQIETAAYARLVAENQMAIALAETRARALERGVSTGQEAMAGIEWSWTRVVAPTADPDVDRVEITVSPLDSDREAARLLGFRGRP